MTPHHRSFESTYGSVSALGLRWQSLIVSPEKLQWMNPPAVGDDPKFQWWNAAAASALFLLASSRGESVRFLYYDGPTLAKGLIAATLDGNILHLKPQRLPSDDDESFHGQNPPSSLNVPLAH